MMTIQAWHGTNQEFGEFDTGHLGLNTRNSASEQAFFFAMRPDTAWDYALKASRTLVPGQVEMDAKIASLLAAAQAAERRRDFETAERFISQAEEMETAALQAEPSGARLLLCEISLENPLIISGREWQVVADLASVLERAKKTGHDAVIIEAISDTPSGMPDPDDHVAIFDGRKARIVAPFFSLEDAETEILGRGCAFEM
jgi:hypothetical protein